jgi:hypothetical protein
MSSWNVGQTRYGLVLDRVLQLRCGKWTRLSREMRMPTAKCQIRLEERGSSCGRGQNQDHERSQRGAGDQGKQSVHRMKMKIWFPVGSQKTSHDNPPPREEMGLSRNFPT